jgi:large subunit ribosomal protein L30
LEKIKITQIKSAIGTIPKHRLTLKALGLGRIGKSRIHSQNNSLKGKIRQVGYLLKVETINQ